MQEWDFIKNSELGYSPDSFSRGSSKKVWWKCKQGHEWEALISSRSRGCGCPYCSNRKVLKGFNDLATLFPDLAIEWHPLKNGELTPADYTYGSGKKVWWICKNGHEYQASIHNRTRGTACPKCADALKTSFPEQAVYYYVHKAFPDAISRYTDIFENGMELDVFIPSLKVGIEYDGSAYHNKNTLKKDNTKYNICKENGISFIRIVETSPSTVFRLQDHKLEVPNGKRKHLNSIISQLCFYLGKPVDVNIERDRMLIMQHLSKRDRSLASEYPEIAAEWDYDYNAPQTPDHFDPFSNEKVGWVCKNCGHKWVTGIVSRTYDGTNCPKCASHLAREKQIANRINEKGSLFDTFPLLMEEWDFEDNNVDPHKILPGSATKVNWICKKCGYKWTASINKRTMGHKCPLCSNQVVVAGRNDLLSKDPDLSAEWDYERNAFGPDSVAQYSNKKVWWKCKICGNSWVAAINNRSQNHGCPYCSGRTPIIGFNDFKTKYPIIAEDWNYEKNNDLKPEQFLPKSSKRVWWKCRICGYEWQASIKSRSNGSVCKQCQTKAK